MQEAQRPEGAALQVTLVGELVAGWGFPRRRLYAEYRILYDQGVWRLVPPPQGLRDSTCPRAGTIRVRCRCLYSTLRLFMALLSGVPSRHSCEAARRWHHELVVSACFVCSFSACRS